MNIKCNQSAEAARGLPRVYLGFRKSEYAMFHQTAIAEILEQSECAIWHKDPALPLCIADINEIRKMEIFIAAYGPSLERDRQLEEELKLALEWGMRILIIQTVDIFGVSAEVFKAATVFSRKADNYKESLKNFLKNNLISASDARKIIERTFAEVDALKSSAKTPKDFRNLQELCIAGAGFTESRCDRETAKRFFDAAAEALESIPEHEKTLEDLQTLSRRYLRLAVLTRQLGDSEGAAAYREKSSDARARWSKKKGPPPPEERRKEAERHVADGEEALEFDLGDAKHYFSKAIAILEALVKELNDPNDRRLIAEINKKIADATAEKGFNDSATEYYIRSREIAEPLFAETRGEKDYNFLGLLYYRMGFAQSDPKAANAFFKRAFSVWSCLARVFPETKLYKVLMDKAKAKIK